MSINEMLSTAFVGPYIGDQHGDTQQERKQLLYDSLWHWFEAAKFMPQHPDLRDGVLCCPTPKEVRRYGRLRQAQTRPDWALVRHRVLVFGLRMLAMQRPELGLMDERPQRVLHRLQDLDLPQTLLSQCTSEFCAWRNFSRVAVLGADRAPPEAVGRRMNKLLQSDKPWALLWPSHGKTSWQVHDWALTHFIHPIYVATGNGRGGKKLTEALISQADQVVIFEQRGAKEQDGSIQLARQASKKMTLDLYDAQDHRNQTWSFL